MLIKSHAVKRITSSSAPSSAALAAEITNTRLIEYGRSLMKEYGAHTVLNRALTDYRDGLKPVHRRILWGAYREGYSHTKNPVKAAKIIGNVMGNFHPHGEMAIYDAMETMARKVPYAMLDGTISNFGSITDSKAASRYVETRLTKYADTVLLDKKYIDIIPMVPNYDGKDKEPLYLPALLPNLLMNGAEGIAVGVRTGIPPVHPESIIKSAIAYMKTSQPITSDQILADIAFNFAIPCDCLSTMDDVKSWLSYGVGSLKFGPIYNWDANSRTLTITGVPVPFNWDNISSKLLYSPEKSARSAFDFTKYIASAMDSTDKNSDGVEFEIKFKAAIDDNQTVVLAKVLKLFNQSYSTYSSFTIRNSETDIQFGFEPMPNLLMRWCQYRVDLEKRYQRYHITELAVEFQKQKLMMFARQHIDLIIAIVKTSSKPAEELVAKLKITPEIAKQILDLALRQLTRISINSIQQKMMEIKKEAEESNRIFNNPIPTLINHLSGPMATLVL